jgi:hypothetical protein
LVIYSQHSEREELDRGTFWSSTTIKERIAAG